jgi:hypothetical protein
MDFLLLALALSVPPEFPKERQTLFFLVGDDVQSNLLKSELTIPWKKRVRPEFRKRVLNSPETLRILNWYETKRLFIITHYDIKFIDYNTTITSASPVSYKFYKRRKWIKMSERAFSDSATPLLTVLTIVVQWEMPEWIESAWRTERNAYQISFNKRRTLGYKMFIENSKKWLKVKNYTGYGYYRNKFTGSTDMTKHPIPKPPSIMAPFPFRRWADDSKYAEFQIKRKKWLDTWEYVKDETATERRAEYEPPYNPIEKPTEDSFVMPWETSNKEQKLYLKYFTPPLKSR